MMGTVRRTKELTAGLLLTFLTSSANAETSPADIFNSGKEVIKEGSSFISYLFGFVMFLLYLGIILYGFKLGFDGYQEESQRMGAQTGKQKILTFLKHQLPTGFLATVLVVVGSYFLARIHPALSVFYLFQKFFSL